MDNGKNKRPLGKRSRLLMKIAIIQTAWFFFVVGQVLSVFLSATGSLFPGADAMKDIVSSFAEIVAGLYSLTLAGYTFFLSRIDGLMQADSTLDYVVVNVKNRFKHLIYFISGSVIIVLFISLVLMYTPEPSGTWMPFFYRLFCNEFILFVISAIVQILYYSILVVDPNCLEKEAKKQKEKLSSSDGAPGSVHEFIALYDKIKETCNAMLPENVLEQIYENKGKRFSYSISLLQEQHPELEALLEEILRIHHYYGCMINCTSLSVSQEMCLIAQCVLTQLEKETVPQ